MTQAFEPSAASSATLRCCAVGALLVAALSWQLHAPRAATAAPATVTTFEFEDDEELQSFEVPTGICWIDVVLDGAGGGAGGTLGVAPAPSRGASVVGRLKVVPGEELRVQVGGKGFNGQTDENQVFSFGPGGEPGWPDGGKGGTGRGTDDPFVAGYGGGGGGGSSAIRRAPFFIADRIAVAGGGGGQGGQASGQGGTGGAGGANGVDGAGGFQGGSGGGGAIGIEGGTAGTDQGIVPFDTFAADGSEGEAGYGSSRQDWPHGGGGGGGGWAGGGGGGSSQVTAANGGGGGGGSSLVPLEGFVLAGTNVGHGFVSIAVDPVDGACTEPPQPPFEPTTTTTTDPSTTMVPSPTTTTTSSTPAPATPSTTSSSSAPSDSAEGVSAGGRVAPAGAVPLPGVPTYAG